MTPDEMRAAADFTARQIPRDDIEADALRTLADAARRLADVIEETTNHPEPECEKHPDGDVFKCGWKRAYTGVFKIVREEQT